MKFIKLKSKGFVIDKVNEDVSFAYFSRSSVIRWIFIKRLKKALNLIDKEDLSQKRILDIGTGCGYLIPSLVEFGEVYALDKTLLYLQKAKKLCIYNEVKSNFIASDLERLPFGDKRFEIVMCISVLEHLKNVEPAIQEINRILGDKGTVIVGVPVERFLVNSLFALLGTIKSIMTKKISWGVQNKNKYQEVHYTDFLEIEKKLNENFNVTKIKTIPSLNSFPIPHSFLLYKLYKCKKKRSIFSEKNEEEN